MPTTTCRQTGLEIVPLWINGEPQASSPLIKIEVLSSTKQKTVFLAEAANVSTAILAVESAASAFPSWRLVSAASRRDLLLRVATIFEDRRAELVAFEIEETSCTKEWAEFNITNTVGTIREMAAKITTACAGELPTMEVDGTMGLVFKEPVGPVLIIPPWNASVILASRGVAAILAAGCTLVLKASELCPRTHHFIAEVFQAAGAPDGVINVIQCLREDAPAVTEAIIAHKDIKKIEFIGSAAVGKAIGILGGKYLKPVLMELGGKCSAIVLEDANLEDAADKCAVGAFLHHGQICFSTERIIVHKSIADNFIPLLVQKAANFATGHGATKEIVHKAHEKLVEASQKGARFLLGGPDFVDHASLGPALIEGVTKEMSIWDEETFGPSASVFIVDTKNEAICIANDSKYGLNAAIHTMNFQKAIELGRRLEVAQVHVNAMTEHDEPTFPLGAVKGSGWGRNNGRYGIDEFLSPKVISLNMGNKKLAFEAHSNL